jgi:hypothetical protein
LSYEAFYAAAGLIDSHPALKAVSPQAPESDWLIGDGLHRNGAPWPLPWRLRGESPMGTGIIWIGPLSNLPADASSGGAGAAGPWTETVEHPLMTPIGSRATSFRICATFARRFRSWGMVWRVQSLWLDACLWGLVGLAIGNIFTALITYPDLDQSTGWPMRLREIWNL